MRKRFLMVCMLLGAMVGSGALCSCSSESDDPLQEVQSGTIVEKGMVTLSMDGTVSGSATRVATGNSGQHVWESTDVLLAVSNGQVCGKLSLVSGAGTATATFKGQLGSFDSKSVRFYYLGNKSVDGMKPVFDLSLQKGDGTSITDLMMLPPVELTESSQGSGDWAPASQNLQMTPLVSTLTLNVTPDASGMLAGCKAKEIQVSGLYNQVAVDLATGQVTGGFKTYSDGSDYKNITLKAANAASYTNTWMLAVLPQQAASVRVMATYADGTPNGFVLTSNTFTWDILSGMNYTVQQAGNGDLIMTGASATSTKDGYLAGSVTGGERADGQNTKGGYGGANADPDASDNPQGVKDGYTGGDLVNPVVEGDHNATPVGSKPGYTGADLTPANK